MPIDLSNTPSLRLNPTQELRLTKPETELYVGQVLKAVVVKTLSENQVLININGENINAQTSQHISPGDLLQIKVLRTDEDPIVLQILKDSPSLTPLEAALAKTLPRQAPATELLASLTVLASAINLPTAVKLQINQLLASLRSTTQLPQQLAQAIANSGLFWEAALLNWRHSKTASNLQNDFKGQCLRLLAALIDEGAQTTNPFPTSIQRESLQLPGTIPQPMQAVPAQSFSGQAMGNVLAIIREQTEQVLARIKTNQLTHLMQSHEQAYNLFLEVPLRTPAGVDLISLAIKEEREETTSSAPVWSISFAIHLTELGNMQAKIKMQGSSVDVHINADKQETIALLESNQSIFDNFMTHLGLTLRLWNLHLGLEEQDNDTGDLRLLDIRI